LKELDSCSCDGSVSRLMDKGRESISFSSSVRGVSGSRDSKERGEQALGLPVVEEVAMVLGTVVVGLEVRLVNAEAAAMLEAAIGLIDGVSPMCTVALQLQL